MEKTRKSDSSANLDFEAGLWLTADKLRNSMDAAEYKHVVSAHGSMTSNQSGKGDTRRALFEGGSVDRMVALPGQLFYSTQIPVFPWFCAKNSTLDSAIDARLFDGETELSLVG